MIAQALGGRGGSYLFQILECILGSCLLCGKKEKSMLVRLIIVFFYYKVHIYYKLVDCLEKCLIYGHIRRFAN